MSGSAASAIAAAIVAALSLVAAWKHQIVPAAICGVIAIGLALYSRRLVEEPDA